jgi:hypothetical protein
VFVTSEKDNKGLPPGCVLLIVIEPLPLLEHDEVVAMIDIDDCWSWDA